LLVLNETLVNFFGKGSDNKVKSNTNASTNSNHCQLCRSKEHMASTCPKLINTRPKCAKCGGGHKTDNFGLKCSFVLVWGIRKTTKKPIAITNFLEILISDEEVILSELN
jgi:hypothetical protein